MHKLWIRWCSLPFGNKIELLSFLLALALATVAAIRRIAKRKKEKKKTIILGYLRDRTISGGTVEQIATATGLKPKTVLPCLNELEKENRAWQHHDGRWRFGSKATSDDKAPGWA
jgi:predicted Rossmann fold nucleotide-binding protein DprA/Smf involved in DNA uptake